MPAQAPEVPHTPWHRWIAPDTLLGQVHNTAPFLKSRLPAPETGALVSLSATPNGYLRVLASWENIYRSGLTFDEQLQDYFALCLACHHATVATFVPTDVDTKIRGLAWRETRDSDALRNMLHFALHAQHWSDDGISTRRIRGVSGHDGEHWSAITGGLGWLLERGQQELAAEALAAIEAEIEREQRIFDATVAERGAELDLLRLAMTMAHNRGDLTQGMGFWKNNPASAPVREHLAEKGRFEDAVRIYQETGMEAEGHRNYPLRPVKALRRSPAELLPLPPFLDDWGAHVINLEDAHEVIEALLHGCQKVQGQMGYYRALAGMRAGAESIFDQQVRRMPSGAQKLLRDPETRKRIDVPKVSFESMMKKRAVAALRK